MKRIVILGATSAIAEAAARLWAAEGAHLVLAGRDASRLQAIAADLGVRGAASVEVSSLDLAACDAATEFARMAGQKPVDVVLLAYGILGDHAQAETDAALAADLLHVNFTSAAAWCMAAARALEAQGGGSLVVIGSVAGDRGRQSNYIYGAAKGGLGILVQGLAHRLARSGARAVLIKPGFVDTPMTAHIPGKGALWSKPEAIARRIVAASSSGPAIAYTPGFWRWIMLAIKSIPSAIFHRTKL